MLLFGAKSGKSKGIVFGNISYSTFASDDLIIQKREFEWIFFWFSYFLG